MIALCTPALDRCATTALGCARERSEGRMGFMMQAGSEIAHFDKFVFSAFVRAPQEILNTFGQIPVMVFGLENTDGHQMFDAGSGSDFATSIISVGGAGLLAYLASEPFQPPYDPSGGGIIK